MNTLKPSVCQLKSIAYCLLSAAFLFSCSQPSPVREQLSRAEQVMETDSRAAALVLDSIDASALRGEEAALFALLKTQADYKSRIRLTSDSLPLIATGYYGTRRKTERAALSQYYLGCTYGDMNRDLDAIDALLRATTLFPDTTNKYFAYSLFELGLKYMNHHMQEEAMEAFKRYRLSKACDGDSVNIGYVDYNMGLAAAYMGQDTLSDSLFHCVIRNTQLPSSYHTATYHQLAKLYYYYFNNPAAWDYIEKYIHLKGRETGAVSLLKADILSEKQEFYLAYENYNKALNDGDDIYTRCMVYKGLTKTALQLGLTDSLQSYMDHYSALLDSIYSISRQEEIARIQESHVVELHDKELEARHRRFLLWVGLFVVVLLMGAIIAYLLADRRRKAEKLRYENALDAIRQRQVEQLAQEEDKAPDVAGYTEEPDEETESIIADAEGMSPFASLQRERIALYRQQYAKSRWARYFGNHHSEIKSGSRYMTEEDAEAFLSYLNALFTDVFMDMLNDNPGLTRQDMEYCAMVMLGLETNQIAYSSRTSTHSCYNRRYRLRERLKKEWYRFVFFSFGG